MGFHELLPFLGHSLTTAEVSLKLKLTLQVLPAPREDKCSKTQSLQRGSLWKRGGNPRRGSVEQLGMRSLVHNWERFQGRTGSHQETIRKPSRARGTAEPGKGFPRKGSQGPGLGWSRSQGEPWAGDRPRCPPAATTERGLAVTPWNGTFLLIPPLPQPGRSASHWECEQGCGTGSPWPCLGWQQQLEAVQSLQKAFLWAGTGAVPVTHHRLAAEPQLGIPE